MILFCHSIPQGSVNPLNIIKSDAAADVNIMLKMRNTAK